MAVLLSTCYSLLSRRHRRRRSTVHLLNFHLFSARNAPCRAAPMLGDGPDAEFSEELRQGRGLVVGIEAAGVGQNPRVAAAEGGLLQTHAGVFDPGDDAVRADADERDDRGPQASDFGRKAPAAGAKFVIGEFIGANGGAVDQIGDAEFEVQKKGIFKRREEARGKPPAIKRGPKAVAGAAEVAPDGGGVEAGVDAHEEDNKVFGHQIRDQFVARGEELGFSGFPCSRQGPIHIIFSAPFVSFVACPEPRWLGIEGCFSWPALSDAEECLSWPALSRVEGWFKICVNP